MKDPRVFKLYKALYQAFGPQHWWPAKTPFEVVVGAILTQNTNWANVEKAIRNLKRGGLLTPKKILEIINSILEIRIKPSGFYRQKTKKLKAFVGHLFQNHAGRLERLFDQGIKGLREELLSLHGIGEETADSIILYAANKPSFVVDAYTKRIGHRMGLFKTSKYDEIKAYFEKNLPRSVKVYNEFHALLVELAKRSCKKEPICLDCLIGCNFLRSRGGRETRLRAGQR